MKNRLNKNLTILSPKPSSLPTATSKDHVRRLTLTFWGTILFGAVLVLRLVQIQVWGGASYLERANDQHKKSVVLDARRGRIFDRNGREIATNLKTISLFVTDNAEVKNPRTVARILSRMTEIDESDLLKTLVGRRRFAWLARKLDYDVVRSSGKENPPGVQNLVEMKRYYPLGTVGCQILGYTDIDNIGIEGGELGLDHHLRAQSGIMVSEVDALGRFLAERGEVLTPPEDGSDVTLTIDADYQWIVEDELLSTVEEFGARAGVAVLMNPRTGEILAMANVPLFDPNHPGDHKPEKRRNRAITDMFEPGSTFKLVAAAAAIDQGIVRPEDEIFCENGRIAVHGGFIRDSHPHGLLTFKQVIEESSNIGAIKVARRLGADRLYEYANRFGFDSRTGIELPGEARGLIRQPSAWSKRSLETIAIGQEVLVTPLQLALAYAAVANDGILMKPKIIKSVSGPGGAGPVEIPRRRGRRVIKESTSRTMVDLLKGVVTHGTGKSAALPGYDIAGKTGTAQQVAEGKIGYESGAYVSSFVGFLPADDPRLLCLVAIDRPTGTHWASAVASPTFRRIMQRVLTRRQNLKPSLLAKADIQKSQPGAKRRMVMPNIIGLSLQSAEKVLRRYRMSATFEVPYRSNAAFVTEQSVQAGEPLNSDVRISVKCKPMMVAHSPFDISVPNLNGLPLRQAINRLSIEGLRTSISGNGLVASQSLLPGSVVKSGTSCALICLPAQPPTERPMEFAYQISEWEMRN